MELSELRTDLSRVRTAHARSVAWASKYVKGALVIGGAAIAGAAQFWTWPAGGTPDGAQILGLLATAVVAVGGFYVLATEVDAADAIAIADKAVEEAHVEESRFEAVGSFVDGFNRLAETYQLCLALRGAVEQSGVGMTGDIDDLVRTMFDLVIRPMTISIGFEQSDRWTLGIYKAVPSAIPGRMDLRCIAHDRAIKCQLNESRVWPEGVGIAGIAYANSREIVLPDLRAEGMGAVFGPRNLTRPYDTERYVSMVAVPIKVAGHAKPWGVVNATSDKAGHFSAESRPGFKTDEPVRALAAFIALAVAMVEARDRAHTHPTPAVTPRSPLLS